MQDFRISVTNAPRPEVMERLRDGLSEHSSPFVATPGFEPVAVLAENDRGELSGGAAGRVNWTWLHVKHVWVAERARSRGLGSLLLERLEAEGRARGCRNAHLDTFSYQAQPFYERHGYRAFGQLDEYPHGHSRIFLSKSL